jgi:hypothetical protein
MKHNTYIIYKSSRCYYGGLGRKDKEYQSIDEAAQGAIDDGNPVGFDIYVKVEPSKAIQEPVVKWDAIRH